METVINKNTILGTDNRTTISTKMASQEKKGFISLKDDSGNYVKTYFRYQGPKDTDFDKLRSTSIPKLILFVGTLGTDTRIWRHQQEHFSVEFHTLAIDLRGSGRTSVLDQNGNDITVESDFSYEEFVFDIRNLLAHMNVKKVVYVGVGVGASIGIRFAAACPHLVDKLFICGAIPWYVVSQEVDYLFSEYTTAELEKTWSRIDQNYDNFIKQQLRTFCSQNEISNEEDGSKKLVRSVCDEVEKLVRENFTFYKKPVLLRILGKDNTKSFVFKNIFDSIKELNNLKIPIIITFSSSNSSIYRGSSGFLFNSLLKTGALIYEFVDHSLLVNWTDSERFNTVLENFIFR